MQRLMDYLAAIEADPCGPDAVVSVLADTARAVHALATLGEEGDLYIDGLNELDLFRARDLAVARTTMVGLMERCTCCGAAQARTDDEDPIVALLARCVQTMNAALDLHYGDEVVLDGEVLSPDEMYAALNGAALRRELDDDPTLSLDGALVLDSIRRGLASALSS
jgi:hypothetical protein